MSTRAQRVAFRHREVMEGWVCWVPMHVKCRQMHVHLLVSRSIGSLRHMCFQVHVYVYTYIYKFLWM